jgi:hypothetical protein
VGSGGVEAVAGGGTAAFVVMGSSDPHGTGVVDSVAPCSNQVLLRVTLNFSAVQQGKDHCSQPFLCQWAIIEPFFMHWG